jgi:pimeloyl-ACP methyl ester carboxylesterase
MARLFHLDTGAGLAGGPPLVLVHGAGGTHAHWPAEVRALPGRRVIALDLPGHGRSAGPSPRTLAGFAESVIALLDALQIDAAVIGGHSMGGAIALTLALAAKARVAGLVLVGTGAKLRVAPIILQLASDEATRAAAGDAIADASFGSAASPALRRAFAEGLEANPPGLVHDDFAACDSFDVMARLFEIDAPTLIVCGEEDRLTPPKYSEHLQGAMSAPRARPRLTRVPNAGHAVMLEAPRVVAAAIEDFLATSS